MSDIRERRRRLLATVMGGGLSLYQQYLNFVQNTLTPTLWYKLNETSGTSPINSGSASLTATWTPGSGSLGQTGQLGANEAYDFDGATSSGSIIAIANNATLKALTTQRWAFLCHPDSLGASNSGFLAVWGSLGATDHRILSFTTTDRIQALINTNGTNAQAVSANNAITDCLGAWCGLFMDYDDAGTRKIRIWKIVGGAITQLTLGTDTAAVGTVDQPASALNIGNLGGRTLTFDGQVDEVIGGSGLWTTPLLTQVGTFWGLLS